MNKYLVTVFGLVVSAATITSSAWAQTSGTKKDIKRTSYSVVGIVPIARLVRSGQGFAVPPESTPAEREALRNQEDERFKLITLARAAYAAQEYAKAETLYLQAIPLGLRVNDKLSKCDITVELSEVYLQQGRNQESLKILMEDEDAHQMTNYFVDVALAYFRLGNHNLALQYLSRNPPSSFSDPDYTKDLPGLGTGRGLEARILTARATNGCFDDATMPDLYEALKLSPGNPVLSYLIANKLSQNKRYKEALPYLETAGKTGTGEYAKLAKACAGSIVAFYQQEQERQQAAVQGTQAAQTKPPESPAPKH